MPTFTRRGTRWRVQVFKRGVRKGMTFDTKAAAEQWARRIESEIDAGHAGGHVVSRETVGALIERYVREVKPLKRWGLDRLRTELGIFGPETLRLRQL